MNAIKTVQPKPDSTASPGFFQNSTKAEIQQTAVKTIAVILIITVSIIQLFLKIPVRWNVFLFLTSP